MGGTIGMMLAARHPEAVGRLMVVDMIPFMGVMLGGAGATSQSVAPIADQVAASMADATPPEYQARAAAAVTGMIKTESRRAGPLQDTATTDQQIAAPGLNPGQGDGDVTGQGRTGAQQSSGGDGGERPWS